jgi:hypothetical protein
MASEDLIAVVRHNPVLCGYSAEREVPGSSLALSSWVCEPSEQSRLRGYSFGYSPHPTSTAPVIFYR